MTEASPLPLSARLVLVVDDTPSVKGLLQRTLEDAGATVRTAEDGADALVKLRSFTPELILLDLSMPRLDGWGVLESLSTRPETARIPVVLQTSANDLESFERARKRGVAAFISKPFRLGEVVETCRRILDGARPLQGRDVSGGGEPRVRMQPVEGGAWTLGFLLDWSGKGAQVDLERPFPLGQRVRLDAEDHPAREGEVRWLTALSGRFQHGLVFRD